MRIENKSITIDYQVVESVDHLDEARFELINAAKTASKLAYAPYSNFYVGAAARLDNGVITIASNKENASFPAGICAERNLVNYISDHHQGQVINSIAVIADPQDFKLNEPVSPCGICRQVLSEVERLQKSKIEIILSRQTGKVLIFSSAASLLPFEFYLSQLKK